MFVVTRSPKGGKMLGDVRGSQWLAAAKNLIFDPDKKQSEVGDLIAWRLGWASEDIKAGDPIHIKKSDARHLKKLIDQYVL